VSFDPFGRSPDLAALVDHGFELKLTSTGNLLVKGVPYLDDRGQVALGTIVAKIEMNGDVSVNPVQDHVVRFIGSVPYTSQREVSKIFNSSGDNEIEPGIVVNHTFSAKPTDGIPYANNFDKITNYVRLLETEAQVVQPEVTARMYRPCEIDHAEWPFEYVDSASGRAGIGALSWKLSDECIAIVGVGGTGSYILDLVAKCPVREIHIFDGDVFSTHNAFRSPGASSLEELRVGEFKTEYFQRRYSNMKRNIASHPYFIDLANVGELKDVSFVFLAMEGGDRKRIVVQALESMGKPFIDVSLGVVRSDERDSLLASVEINTSTVENRETFRSKVDLGQVTEDDPYSENIQIAELNALNASLAVLNWKRMAGIYHRQQAPFHQRLNVAFNRLISEY